MPREDPSLSTQLRMTLALPSLFHISAACAPWTRCTMGDMKNAIAIIFIFLCTAIAWIILGATIERRTFAAGSGLGPRVASSWGSPQQQVPPMAVIERVVTKQVREVVNGQNIARTVEETTVTPLALERSRVRAGLDLEQRKKGLLWFPTYRVAFRGDYVFRNTTDSDDVTLRLAFPAADAIYDDLTFIVDGRAIRTNAVNGVVDASVRVPVGGTVRLETGYRSQGLSTWTYSFGEGVSQVRDFQLDMQTNFKAIDFPAGTLSPTVEESHARRLAAGVELQQPRHRLAHRHGDAGEAPARTAGRPHQLLRARVAAVLLLPDVHHHDTAPHRAPSDALLLPRRVVLLLPPAPRLPGRPHLHPPRPGHRLGRSRSSWSSAICGSPSARASRSSRPA